MRRHADVQDWQQGAISARTHTQQGTARLARACRNLLLAMRAASILAGPTRAVILVGGAKMMLICARLPPVSQRWPTSAASRGSSHHRRPGRSTEASNASAARRASICSSQPAAAAAVGRPAGHDVVVNKCVLTVGFWEGNNVGGKALISPGT